MPHHCRLIFLLVLAGLAAVGTARAEPTDKDRAFGQFCGDGACAPQGLSQSEFDARIESSRYGAGSVEYFDREIDRFREKFLGHDKFTLEIMLRVDRPGPAALAIDGLFVSWFDDDIASLQSKEYSRTCGIFSSSPLLCKIKDDRVVIWFDREMALHLVELVYDAARKAYKTRQHRVIRRKAG